MDVNFYYSYSTNLYIKFVCIGAEFKFNLEFSGNTSICKEAVSLFMLQAFMFPFSVLWGLYNALSYVAPTSSVTNVLFTLANYATELALVPSCFHFFVYIVLIRAFRDRLSCTRVSASAYSGNTNRSEL